MLLVSSTDSSCAMGENSDTMSGKDDNVTASNDQPRRRFLQILGGASAAIGSSGIVGAQETTTDGAGQSTQTTTTDETTSIVLGGQTAYWLGLAPKAIEGQQNPTLQLQSDQQYRLLWVNLDGQQHQWQIEDGEENVLERTEPTQQIGATQSVTFEATDEMAQYRCQFHPEQMQGSVELGTGFETTSPTETTENEQTTTAAGGEVVDVAVGPEENTLRFRPEEVEISVGDSVRWTAESPGHNVSCKPEADRKVELPDGAEPFASYEGNRSFSVMEVDSTFERTFSTPGTYVYVCTPHADQGMVGRVIVAE